MQGLPQPQAQVPPGVAGEWIARNLLGWTGPQPDDPTQTSLPELQQQAEELIGRMIGNAAQTGADWLTDPRAVEWLMKYGDSTPIEEPPPPENPAEGLMNRAWQPPWQQLMWDENAQQIMEMLQQELEARP